MSTKSEVPASARPVDAVLSMDKVELGVLNLAGNVRQIPLVFSGISPDGGSVSEYDGISWKAASLFDSGNMKRVREMFNPTDEYAPYAGFLTRGVTKSHTFSALGAVCGIDRPRAQSLGLDCTRAPVFPAERLQNRVVIIGEKTENDIHDSPIGGIHGYFLHANYIEALLDGRYYFPASAKLNYLLAGTMFFVMELVFFYLEKRNPFVLFGAVLAVCVALLSIEFILAQAFHLLLLPMISFGQLLGQLVERLAERILSFFHSKPTG